MQRSYSVRVSPADGIFATKYPALAHLPFILDSRPRFHRLANRYLAERGLGVWTPPSTPNGSTPRLPTVKSMRNYADWLSNFLEWADVRSVDLVTCSYSVDVAGRYQGEMLQGTWSRDGKGSVAEEVESEDDPETDESDTQTDLEQLEVRWPPQNYTDLVHLFGTLQAAHLVVALLSNGPRHSEVISLPLDCVVYARDGRPYANGMTFKLVEWNGGAQRDWLLPELGMEAIEQQTRLVRLCESVGFLSPSETARMTPASKDLWRRFSANQA